MQCSPYEIKDKLLKALDEDNNVVDMAAVIEVISLLERTPITKDTLERTRLGKYINELRKRTTNEPLARRAKELVKSWRRLLPCDQTPNGGGPPVVGPGPGPGIGPGPGPGLPRRSPSCSSVSNSPVPPSLLAAAAAVTTAGAGPGLGPRRNGGFKPVSPACCPSAPCSPGSPLAHPHPRSPPPLEPVAKNNVANKRLRKLNAPDSAKKAAWSPPNGVHPWDPIPSGNSAFESVRNRVATISHATTSPRLPKVKTTQQLIAELKAKSGLSLDSSAVAAAAAAAAAATPPPTSSSRPKRSGNYSLLGTDDETSRTKSELMDRFLQSSSSVPNGPAVPSSSAVPATTAGAPGEVAAILSALPEIGPDVDLEEEETPTVPLEVTPEVEERFATQQWEFVNGVYDHEGQWKGWHEVTTGRSYTGDILHMLPYVNIDW